MYASHKLYVLTGTTYSTNMLCFDLKQLGS